MGTPLYMSPEQVEGRPLDPRTDIYSFGVTCYHLLAGQPPFRGQSAFEVAAQHVQKEPLSLAQLRPDLPPELCAIVHKMMAKKPEDRYQTAREIVKDVSRLRDMLVGVVSGQTGFLLATGPAAPLPSDAQATLTLPRYRARRWLRALVPLSLLLAFAGSLAYGWWQHEPAPAAPPRGEPTQVQTVKLPTPKQEQERLLREQLKSSQSVEDYVKLGLFYLEDRRLDDAERFFKKDLEEKYPEGELHLLGRLGQAMVLAFRDEAQESVKLFKAVYWEVWTEKNKYKVKKDVGPPKIKGPPPKVPLLLWENSPALWEMMARALDRNVINLSPRPSPKSPLGKWLEQLRHVPPKIP
jgi:serine/threonine-protein kinase